LLEPNFYVDLFLGIKEEGIFRLSGSSTHIKELRESVDRGEELDLTPVRDEHVVTGLLKLYFRELPESLFTRQLSAELRLTDSTFLIFSQFLNFSRNVTRGTDFAT
jgi:hypothetical protein